MKSGHIWLALIALSSAWPGRSFAAEPYFSMPSEVAKNCKKPAVKIPNDVLSLFYPSDECGVIFVGPPSRLSATVAASFSSVSQSDCAAIQSLLDEKNEILKHRAEVAKKITNNELNLQQATEEKGKISIASDIIAEGLADDYNTFGSKSTIAIQQNWQENVQLYAKENPDYTVYPLYTAAGILSFEEKVVPDTYETFGLFDNKLKAPFIEFTVSGMTPIAADSPLLDEGKLPIFFPTARVDRANLKSVEFGGGGISASVTLNRAGQCDFMRTDNQNLSSFLTPTVTYAMAIKTSGEYTVEVNVDYLMVVLKSLSKSSTGTASALALSDDFFVNRSSKSINVVMNDDLKASLTTKEKEDGFVQTALIDVANQFLTAVTGVAGEKKDVQLPAVQDVEKYKTIQQWQRVCNRSGGFLGIGASSHCYDQAYNVKVLQDTSQFQSAAAAVAATFSGGGTTKVRSYILVPWNASL